jgi:tetraacyldisaccharide 4'-kinase
LTWNGSYYRELIQGNQHGFWARVGRGGLRAASAPYGWVMALRNRAYDSGWFPQTRVACPVVCIGNLTLGGTGKTPFVEHVTRFCHERGRRVAILSRGYGSRDEPNDEALVLAENLPDVSHRQSPDRVALALEACRDDLADVLILDDGFQHRRLARDLDFVLIDATQSWGHEYVFPRGLLREPWTGLGRAGIIVLTRSDLVGDRERGRLREAVAQVAPQSILAEARHAPRDLVDPAGKTHALEALREQPLAAFCGIGNPRAFFQTIQRLGGNLICTCEFADHCAYSPADLGRLSAWIRGLPSGVLLVATHKDLVKVRHVRHWIHPILALRVGIEITAGRERLERRLAQVITANGSSVPTQDRGHGTYEGGFDGSDDDARHGVFRHDAAEAL